LIYFYFYFCLILVYDLTDRIFNKHNITGNSDTDQTESFSTCHEENDETHQHTTYTIKVNLYIICVFTIFNLI